MPLSPAVADPYATGPDGEPQPDSIPAEYAALVAALLAALAVAVAPKPGVNVAVWAQETLWGLVRWRAKVRGLLLNTAVEVARLARSHVRDAWARGAAEGAVDARWLGGLPDLPDGVVEGLVEALGAAHPRVEAVLEDAYRRAVYAARDAQGDPRPAVQRVLDDLASRGVTGYVDRAGRHWSLETYVETAVRWRLADAALQGYVQSCLRAGVRFAAISVNHSSHKACLVWEGRVVSLDGSPRGAYLVRTAAGRTVTVECAGTLEESRLAGVWHPWCQHRITALIPGAGRRARGPAAPTVDRVARAQRRYWARAARAWDRRTRVALTDQARVRARQAARRWRGRSRREE